MDAPAPTRHTSKTSDHIFLKVDVDTFRGTQEGVPALLRLLDRYGVRATFLFSLGPDHTGRALRRVFRRGFLRKVRRTSVVSHYGLKTLMYGVLLPGPHIGRRSRAIVRQTDAEGHETGLHCYDHILWQDYVARRDAVWTQREMQAAQTIYEELMGKPATMHGAAGWQINPHVLAVEEAWGLPYASDTRGTHPFLPVMADGTGKGAGQGAGTVGKDGTGKDGQAIAASGGSRHPRAFACPQFPTTLPTLDELLGMDGMDVDHLHEAVLAQSRQPRPWGHVYTLHAELEGMQLLPVMERLLQAWQAEGFVVGALADLQGRLAGEVLPCHRVVWGEVPGRSGVLAMQGEALPTV